ncbi:MULTISPECIES: phenylacetate--CoA ligase family protein [Mycobacterium]|uniref:phenylacetate--CoA ligase family protein n=1 Tax=Mycobacterium TaxID=1763 RepID=UPI001EF014A4|nr:MULTISPECIES: hypothetical protein [Mycobacterium]
MITAVNIAAPEQFNALFFSTDEILAAQRRSLHTLLSHAVEHSPFHRRRLGDIDVTDIDPTDLSALPVMTKAEMMEALDDVFTDPRLRRGDIESSLAATVERPVPILDDYIALSTGGCSGRRGLFVYDRAATAGFLSALARPPVESLRCATAPTKPPRIAMVAAPSAVHATGLLAALTEGGDAPAHVDLVPATQPIWEIVDRLNAWQPEVLGGYASMLVRLAVEAGAGRLRIAPTEVNTTSETLLPEMRVSIREAFGVPVFDGFGSTEGLVGKTGPDDDVFAFNTDMCIVELVDADNRPVAPGVPSAKVLVTNLYNLVQPLIRYELTDIFTRQPDADEHGHLRARVQGRSDDVLRYQHTTIHPIAIRSVLATTPGVTDYQVHQTVCGIEVFAIFEDDRVQYGLAGRLRRALVDAGLNRPEVTVHAVDRVDRHPVSGKLRRFVPLI